jgi:PTH2 family peptidyl-tRNA hydrolase
MGDKELVIYLVVRKDLKMRTGKIAAQCGHAVEYLAMHTPKPVMHEYRNSGHPKVALQVPTLEDLEFLESECIRSRVQCHMVEDEGRTQVPAGSRTVLGIGPVRKENVPKAVAALKLL